MGLFGSLFGKSEKPVTDPDRLRDELLAAARAGDAARLERLARANQAAVLEHFRAWQRVPEAVRSDPGALRHYVNGLIAAPPEPPDCAAAGRTSHPAAVSARSWTPPPSPPGSTAS